jgi:hypothetical protein
MKKTTTKAAQNNKQKNDVNEKRSPKRDNRKEEKKEKEIIYPVASKPLDFSFRNIKYLDALILTEARGGERRSIEEIEKEEKVKSEKVQKVVDTENSLEDEEFMEKKQKSKAVKEEVSEVVEMRIHDKSSEEKKGKSQFVNKKDVQEEKSTSLKKKVLYVNYTNSVILHDNEIENLANIDVVFSQILIEPSFLSNTGRNKLELIQWLDLSHNHLKEIHIDIQKLVFLKILYLHANYISEIDAVKALAGCNCLINLTLHGNSIEHIKGYRHFIIEMIPKLEKLDFTLVSEKELDVIYFKGCRYGEVRDKLTGKVLVYPKLDDRFVKRLKEDKNQQKPTD